MPEFTVPEPPPVTQVPATEKQPLVTLSPLYKVEVALATKLPTPLIERMEPGEVVPMPTLPDETTSWLLPTARPFETRESAPLVAKEDVAVAPKYAGP